MFALRRAPWRRNQLQRRSDYNLMPNFDRFINRFFEDFDMEPFSTGDDGTFVPSLDVSENDHEIKVMAELPGLDESDVEVSLLKNVLTISGEKKAETEDKGDNYHRIERSYGSFKRSVTLPAEVDTDAVDANFKNGILTVTLPKSPEAQKQVKKIAVKSS